jgi:hypothetical protein
VYNSLIIDICIKIDNSIKEKDVSVEHQNDYKDQMCT